MSTKLSGCGKINRRRDTGQWFWITDAWPSCFCFSTQKSVNGALLSVFRLQSRCRLPPAWNRHKCFYFVRWGFPDSWKLHQKSKRQVVILFSAAARCSSKQWPTDPAHDLRRSVVCLGPVLCLAGLSSTRSTCTRVHVPVSRAILMQDRCALRCNQALRTSALWKQRLVVFPQPTLWTLFSSQYPC